MAPLNMGTKAKHADSIVAELREIVGSASVLSDPDELLVYECDGLPQHKYRPRAVVFPASTEETSAVMRALAHAGVPFTPRGAGTGLSGGALSLNQGVVVELARLRQILHVDPANRIAVVQPGVVNSHVSRAVAHLGLHYVPDPSSQPTCTIGGNIAENAGGIHCLKYGTTTDHVLGVRVVLAGGEVVDLGGAGTEATGYDLLGCFVGSEGTFGIVTEATLRLTPIPPAVRTMLAEFVEVNDASHAVSAIIAAGVMPAALEMMDSEIIRAVEASVFAAGLPLDVGAALLIELDGIEAGIDEEAEQVKSVCLQYGARSCRLARDENERKKLWAARKGAFGAIGRIAPDSMIQDAVVPRSRLPEVLADVFRIASTYQLRIANVFHAGDGNLHPLICFDSRSADEVRRVKAASRELMETCVRAGGSITGEHGVGFDKRELLSLIFSDRDMETMLSVRAAFDPTGLCNPGKIIPLLRGCGEARAIFQTTQPTPPEVGDLLGPRASRPQGPADSSLWDTDEQRLSPRNGGNLAGSRASFNPDVAAERLSAVVGEANIFAAAFDHVPTTPKSSLTVTPGSIAEVCEVIKLAASEAWTVVPAGAMTWLNAGRAMEQPHLIVSMQRLNRIIEHEPADLIAISEAGVTLKDFNETLGEKGQWLPLDPPDNGRATIGGVVATGMGGAQQFGYGAPRRHVIGMKVVRADGSLIKVGGRVVKNVAGYDLCKLFTGSYGTLGLIVEVNFKLRPLPFKTSTTMASGAFENLLEVARRVIESRLFPVAVELLSPSLAKEAGWPAGRDHLLLIRFAGSINGVAAQTSATAELLKEKTGAEHNRVIAEDASVWNTLATLPSRFENDLVWRVGLRPADVGAFLSIYHKTRANGREPRWHAGVGDGRIRGMESRERLPKRGAESQNSAITRVEELRAVAKRLGAVLMIEQTPEELEYLVGASVVSGGTAEIMRRIKDQLDPVDILSPGCCEFESPLSHSHPASAAERPDDGSQR
jgi:glycolate oxidase subunit GlcD